jgi:hypothetical protein
MRLPEGVGPICGECPNRRGNRVKNPFARFFGHFRTQGLRRTAWKRKSAKSSRDALTCLFWAFYIHFCAITNSLHIGFESRLGRSLFQVANYFGSPINKGFDSDRVKFSKMQFRAVLAKNLLPLLPRMVIHDRCNLTIIAAILFPLAKDLQGPAMRPLFLLTVRPARPI